MARRAIAAAAICAGAAVAQNTYAVNDLSLGPRLQGIGADFTSASARLLLDYAEPYRSQLLDYLFAEPSFVASTTNTGAAVQILKLSIGSDSNEGHGSEPSYLHAQADTPNVQRGWAGWLAKEAVARNPAIKIMLTPMGFPGWLRFGSSATDPYTQPDATAAYVAQYISLFQTSYGVTVGYVGVWGSQAATTTTAQIGYIKSLRAALDSAGLTAVQVVCADQGDWSCADAAVADPALAGAVGVVGNSGLAPSQSAVTTGKPVWSTSFGKYTTTAAGAIALSRDILQSYVNSNGVLSGWIYSYGASGNPYGFPNWHSGLIQATQPWSGHYYVTPALWAMAHITQFVQPGWVFTTVGQGSGKLANGGYYASWINVDSGTYSWVLVVAKYESADGDPTTTETATFQLGGNLAGRWNGAQVTSFYSQMGYYNPANNLTLFTPNPDAVSIAGDQFTVTLTKKGLYTFAVTNPGVHKGCAGRDCQQQAPQPSGFPSTIIDFSGCAAFGPGQYFSDLNGAFECIDDLTYGRVLQQTAVTAPITGASDSRPHTVVGDINAADIDVTVDVYLPIAWPPSAALVGARVTPWNITRGGGSTITALDIAPGVWLYLDEDHWSVFYGLDAGSYANPVATGTLPIPWAWGQWSTLRLVVRGSRAIGFWYQPPSDGGKMADVPAAERSRPSRPFNASTAAAAAERRRLRGGVGAGAGDGPLARPPLKTAPMRLRDGRMVQAAVLFNMDISGAPTAGFAGLATDGYGETTMFRDFMLEVDKSTCDYTPVAGQAVDVELCDGYSPGLAFNFVPVDTALEHIYYYKFPQFDAEDEDTGYVPGCTIDTAMQACTANGTSCVGFNSNCWMKGSTVDLAPNSAADFYVKQLPAGQFQLRSDQTLCLGVGPPGTGTTPLLLVKCDTTQNTQLWTAEQSLTDGSFLCGPLTSVADQRVVDIAYSSTAVDATVDVYGWGQTPNQIWNFDAATGLIRATQMGLCLGACAYL